MSQRDIYSNEISIMNKALNNPYESADRLKRLESIASGLAAELENEGEPEKAEEFRKIQGLLNKSAQEKSTADAASSASKSPTAQGADVVQQQADEAMTYVKSEQKGIITYDMFLHGTNIVFAKFGVDGTGEKIQTISIGELPNIINKDLKTSELNSNLSGSDGA